MFLSLLVFCSTSWATSHVPIPPATPAARINTVEQILYYRLVSSELANNDFFFDESYIMADRDYDPYKKIDPKNMDLSQMDYILSLSVYGKRANPGPHHFNVFGAGYFAGGTGHNQSKDTVIGVSYYNDEEGALHAGPIIHQDAVDGTSTRFFLEGDLYSVKIRSLLDIDPAQLAASTALAAWRMEPDKGIAHLLEFGGGYSGYVQTIDWRTRMVFGPSNDDLDLMVLVIEGDPTMPLREAKAELNTAPPSTLKRPKPGILLGASYFDSPYVERPVLGWSAAFVAKLLTPNDVGGADGVSLRFGWRGQWADDLRKVPGTRELGAVFLDLSMGMRFNSNN
jgi:hypothetical protein